MWRLECEIGEWRLFYRKIFTIFASARTYQPQNCHMFRTVKAFYSSFFVISGQIPFFFFFLLSIQWHSSYHIGIYFLICILQFFLSSSHFVFFFLIWFVYLFFFFFDLWCDWIHSNLVYERSFTWLAFIQVIKKKISPFISNSFFPFSVWFYVDIMNRPFEVVELNAQYFAKLFCCCCVSTC